MPPSMDGREDRLRVHRDPSAIALLSRLRSVVNSASISFLDGGETKIQK
jgi:hypothetical protein